MKKVSHLLCAGCPVQPVGETIQSALHLAVDNDRPRILSLLLAAGATLTYSINNFNLLQQAWNSSNATSAVLCSLTRAYSSRLRAERDRLKSCNEICLEIDTILQTLEGDTPWAAAWGKGESVHLTALMAKAVQANCPTTAAFLQQAGAWCFFSGSEPSPLHAALETEHWSLAKTLVRDLKGCIYIPDREGRSPNDMMPPECRQELEQVTYQQERQKLRALADNQKDEDKKEDVETVLRLQEQLFFGLPVQADSRHYILVVRNGLLHVTHMLLKSGHLKVDDVLDNTNGSTALHEAASHGKTACTALLMTAGADPLQSDRYGHTPLLLAAMFGHSETFHLMAQSVDQYRDCPCRAGTTAHQTKQNYKAYLQCYKKCGDAAQDYLTILDHKEEKQIIKTILKIISNKDLLQEAERANVDFSKGEAKEVKDVVSQEIRKIVESVGRKRPVYKGSLSLVGSSHDGFKLYAPDEFDFNLIISIPEANITVEDNPEREKDLTEPRLMVKLESSDDVLQGNRFMSGLYEAVKEHFDGHLLDDPRLSIVPPGLSKTKIGVALPMAWQGTEYPLLLVSVDLVPVLDVPWNDRVTKPHLTPPETTSMQISNATDGSWRCSFAKVETCVMKQLQLEERQVYLASKTLLSCLKVEPWMPQELKAFCTWWCARQWKIPAPKGFCLKNSFLTLLESKKRNASEWPSTDLMKHIRAVFKSMCSETLAPKLTYAYFGGDCEGPTRSIGAETIIDCFPGE